MKCHKCGFTSFDYLDNCKKCGADLATVKSMLGIIAVSPDELAVASPKGRTAPDLEELISQDDAFDDISFGTDTDHDIDRMSLDGVADEPIGSLVEPTSYSLEDTGNVSFEEELSMPSFSDEPPEKPKQPEPAAAPPKPQADPDDEFLDLDFGGIFEDDNKK